MEYYCRKCLVNRVAHEGDVCAACGGMEQAAGGFGFQSPMPPNSPSDQGWPDITPRQRPMDPASHQTRAPVASPDDDWNDIWPTQPGYGQQTERTGASSSPVSSPRKKGLASRSGVIQNFSAGPDERNFFDRVLDSLLLGISYNGGNNLFLTEFQLYENWNSGYSASSSSPQATRVLYYGKVAQGCPVENNNVTVYGVFDHRHNYFIAERIMNQTDGTFANFMPQKTPVAVIRVLAVGLLLAIVAAAFALFIGGLGGGGGRSGAASSGGIQQILLGLIVAAAGVGAVIWFLTNRQSRPRLPLLVIGALLVFVGIFILTVPDLESRFALLKSEIISTIVMAIVLRIAASLLLSAISRPNPTVESILNWVMVILIVLSIGSAAVNILLA